MYIVRLLRVELLYIDSDVDHLILVMTDKPPTVSLWMSQKYYDLGNSNVLWVGILL
jgi:hypothetical protein